MKTDYMTQDSALPPHMAFPYFLLAIDVRPIAKMIYALLLDMTARAEPKRWVDENGRLYLVVPLTEIARILDRSTTTVRLSLKQLEENGLVERQNAGRPRTDHIYVKLPGCV